MTIQKILSFMRRAISDHNMIKPDDRIAVGLSGGKDSLTLLHALASYQKFSPTPFHLIAITIDMGFKDSNFELLKKHVEDLGVPYHIEKTDIAEILFDIRKEKSPCSLCSKMRRGTLNTCMQRLNYNKLALGHHADDLVETMLLSLFYEGRFSTFAPISHMSRTDISVIRPFVYIEEKNIRAYSKNLPVCKNPCPKDHHTQREYMKNLIKNISEDIPFVKDRMHAAITNPERNNLWDKAAKTFNNSISESE